MSGCFYRSVLSCAASRGKATVRDNCGEEEEVVEILHGAPHRSQFGTQSATFAG
jgi:hypothetical protein